MSYNRVFVYSVCVYLICLVGICVVLIDIPYDITAVKFLHWTWSEPLENVAHSQKQKLGDIRQF